MDTTTAGEPPDRGRDPDRADARARDVALVAAALAGDQQAFGKLYDRWYDRVWNVARRIVRDPDIAAEVAQDAFLSAWRNLGTLESPDAFGGWLLRIARNASFNRQRKEARSSPVDEGALAVIESLGASPSSAPSGFGVEDRARAIDDPAAVAGDAELVELVRSSAGALGERDAEVVDLQLRYGLTPAEIGEVMGMNRNAANQLCHRVRQRFATTVRARVLWRGARPACDALDAMLRSAGVTRFDADAVKIADRHADACPQCRERRELRLQPSALFAAVPLVAAPVLWKQQTAHALEMAGVPMDGSRFSSAAPADRDVPDADAGDAPRDAPARRAARGRVVAMAAAAVVVLVGTVAVLASRTDDATIDEVTVAAEPSSTTIPTTTPSSSTTTPPTPPPTEAPEPVVTEPAIPSSTEGSAPVDEPLAPGPAPVVTVDLGLSPDRVPPYYGRPDFPELAWTVTGAASVRVEGPVGSSTAVLSTDPSGSVPVCPAALVDEHVTSCPVGPGPYRYDVIAFDAAGIEVARRSTTLTVA